ncbi:glycosyltransferase family 2 protein [Rhodohalobacter sp. SW132]|uniref:glycosyltransferase family 2 protein n=1 Tax=Rhodohalobacter sp. SW132 TaxID=2293433 RepID=UPI001FD8725A|nr:glycosyltransferase family 2 protein [Rhodohalobacter sp. SW132]
MAEEDKDKVIHSAHKPQVSVVIPLFNEEESLTELVERIKKALTGFKFEVLLIDDGSDDRSWQIIESLSSEIPEVEGVKLRRNYGKSSALQAGFHSALGDYIITMDADLQDDPFEIPAMIEKLENGADLVSGWKKKRHDPISKTVPSRFFNTVTSWTTGIKLNDFNCGLKAYRREVTEHIHLYGELHRYVPLLAKWQGFDKIEEQEVKHHPRKYGKTKFGLSRFMNGFLDLLTLLFVNRYMQRPMHFFGTIGVLLTVVGMVINTYIAALKIFWGQPIGDRPLIFLGILLVVIGVQFFSIGFLGEMVNKNRVHKYMPGIEKKTGV